MESYKQESKRFSQLYDSLCIDGQLMHVGLILKRIQNLTEDRLAIICDDESISYKTLYKSSLEFAKILNSKNIGKGDIVIIFYENSIDFVIAYFGVWMCGAIVAPLNVFLSQAEFLHIVSDAKPKAIITSNSILKKFSDIDFNTLATFFSTEDIAHAKETKSNLEYSIPSRNIHEMAALLYTSGTTGFPKGVMLSSSNIITNAVQAIARLEKKDEYYKVYCALPLFHSLPQNICLWVNIILMGTSIIVSKIDRRSILKGLEHKPNIIVAVPALYGLFCMLKTIDFSKVKYFVAGGDALSDKIRANFALLYNRKICNGYGLTETSPFIAVDLDDYTQPTHTVGRPFVNIDCQIRDETGKILSLQEIGTLWVKGPNVMLGYYNAPEATNNIIKDGWLCTGDLAFINENGKIVLAGRQKDLIIQKGIKIYPQEVENILLMYPNILQCAVIGIKQNEGEIPIAFVSAKEVSPTLERDLQDFCKQQLALYKIPRQFIIKKELPTTSTGKIDKKLLKLEFEASLSDKV